MRSVIFFLLSFASVASGFAEAATRGGFLCGLNGNRRLLVHEAGSTVGVYSLREESFLWFQLRRAGIVSADPNDFRLIALNSAGIASNKCFPSKAFYRPLPAELQDLLTSLLADLEAGRVQPCDDLIQECQNKRKGMCDPRITNDGSGQKTAK
jgi:hypothetical protein